MGKAQHYQPLAAPTFKIVAMGRPEIKRGETSNWRGF